MRDVLVLICAFDVRCKIVTMVNDLHRGLSQLFHRFNK